MNGVENVCKMYKGLIYLGNCCFIMLITDLGLWLDLHIKTLNQASHPYLRGSQEAGGGSKS